MFHTFPSELLIPAEVFLTVHSADLDRALERCAEFFGNRPTRAGVVARRLLGRPTNQDASLTEQLINERRRRTRLDGGIGGWVVATTWSAWELMQLGCPPDHTGVVRMVGYLLSRQDQPGRFGEGCTPERHERGHCSHVLSGFFSPGTVDERIAPLNIPFGAVVEGEWAARYAASCFTLRTVLQARQERRPAVVAHIESLLELGRRWDQGDFTPDPTLMMFTVSALSLAPITYREQIDAITARATGAQQADGSWAGVSLFHALDTMLGVATPSSRECIQRAGPLLIDQQQPDGSFDSTGNEETALVALRALRTIGPSRFAPKPPRFSSPGARPPKRRGNRAGR